jgi:hypothetical protein
MKSQDFTQATIAREQKERKKNQTSLQKFAELFSRLVGSRPLIVSFLQPLERFRHKY